MNDEAKRELQQYVRKTLWSSLIVISSIIMASVTAYLMKRNALAQMIFGAVLGSLLSSANLFALGYAFWALVIEKKTKWALLYPLLSFFAMSFSAFILAIYFKPQIIGFALGLSMPVIIGALVIASFRNDN